MNQRILKLREQAGLQPYYDAQEGQIEKFAKLIVRECAQIADEPTSQPFGSYSEKIKQYFGVEE